MAQTTWWAPDNPLYGSRLPFKPEQAEGEETPDLNSLTQIALACSGNLMKKHMSHNEAPKPI